MAGGNRRALCARVQAATGWKRRRRAALPVDVSPKCAHFESPRQEEQRSNSRRDENRTIQRSRSRPLAAGRLGLSRAPAPISISQLASPSRAGMLAGSAGKSTANCDGLCHVTLALRAVRSRQYLQSRVPSLVAPICRLRRRPGQTALQARTARNTLRDRGVHGVRPRGTRYVTEGDTVRDRGVHGVSPRGTWCVTEGDMVCHRGGHGV